MTKIIDGKKVARKLQEEMKATIANYTQRKPTLAFVLIGNDPASLTYIRMKIKACKKIGMKSFDFHLEESTTEDKLIHLIQELNRNLKVDGILVQLPLPEHIDQKKVMQFIDPLKDVDGFHPVNMGKLLTGDTSGFCPCTPMGIQTLLKEYNIETHGKHTVIVGRSNIVGKPMGALLVQDNPHANATITIAHRHTKDLRSITRQADILIVAVGKSNLITKDMVKEDAVVIDVGINRVNGKITGDCDFENLLDTCSWITPVPGGVGPMTITSLLQNTLKSFLQTQPYA